MSAAVVLDAAGAFDVIDDSRASGVRALLRRTIDNGGEVRCVAVTLAEDVPGERPHPSSGGCPPAKPPRKSGARGASSAVIGRWFVAAH